MSDEASKAIQLSLEIDRLAALPEMEREFAIASVARMFDCDPAFVRARVNAKIKAAKRKSKTTLEASQDTVPSAACDLTEDTLAVIFAEKFRERLLYCHHAGAWFEWNGSVW